MKTYTIYEANDGTRFRMEAACREHEELADVVESIMAPLGSRPTNEKFEEGFTSVQHSPDTLRTIRAQLMLVAYTLKPNPKLAKQMTDPANTTHSWMQGFLDGSPKPLMQALDRLVCIDADSREWVTPFERVRHAAESEP